MFFIILILIFIFSNSFAYAKPFSPKFNVRGIYVTGWVAGMPERMNNLIDLVNNSVLNSMVIDIKDDVGYLSYKSDVKLANEIGANKSKIKDIKALLSLLDKHNIYTIGRIVVFKDELLASNKKEYALTVKQPFDGSDFVKKYFNVDDLIRLENNDLEKLNKNNLKLTNDNLVLKNQNKIENVDFKIVKSSNWVDPTNKKVWEYNFQLAKEALRLGFDEIQFDYVRYPSLRNGSFVFDKNHNEKIEVIDDFVETAYRELDNFNKNVSIDIFGLVTSISNGMSIGQKYETLSKSAKIISPMVYPSHYSAGVFDLKNPEKRPYETVHYSMKDALEKASHKVVLRPWLQDFTINHKYEAKDVIAQIKAVEELGISEWLLWNSNSRYTEEAIKHFELKKNYEKNRYELVPPY
ncbi:MAG: putative glycoside hydrolase [Bacillota bacterium]